VNPAASSATLACFRLGLSQLRVQPLRTTVTLVTLAFGIALFSAVQLVNAVALNEFSQATRRLAGEADLIVMGPPGGFDEQLYADLAMNEAVRVASPSLDLDVTLTGARGNLAVRGVDTFRASALQPALIGHLSGDLLGLFGASSIHISENAAQALGVKRGDTFSIVVGDSARELTVRGILPSENYPARTGIMDIASAQWLLGMLGRINRIDLQLRPGTDVEAFRANLDPTLPPGVLVSSPAIEAQRPASISRAYRVNLSMLALVSLLTGALLLLATQTFSVLRRRTSLALLRALGATRSDIRRSLLAEGLLLGALASVLGIGMGYAIAWAVTGAAPAVKWTGVAGFFLLGTSVAGVGAWLPAREAARRAPARGLKSGDAELALASLRPSSLGLGLLVLAVALSLLPPIRGIPVFGYAAIASLLTGGLMLVPGSTRKMLALLPADGQPSLSIGLAQVRGSVAQLQVSLAPVIVSFSLMVAMSIMVFSFRQSFVHWLQQSLPADIQLRIPPGSDTRVINAGDQEKLAGIAGIERVELRRSVPLLLASGKADTTLIARDFVPPHPDSVALVNSAPAVPDRIEPVWVSEAMQDNYGMRVGSRAVLPVGGVEVPVFVAGVFRDYGRPGGTVVMERARYMRLSSDRFATEAAIWLQPRADIAEVTSLIRSTLRDGETLEIRGSDELKQLSMRVFDRAFAVTHALEAVAVLIGLIGIACAGASTALARRGEFGMLRHMGMLRRQIVTLLAAEGLCLGVLAAAYGLLLGGAISLVLVHVVNRQSFNWSIDLALSGWQLAAFSLALVLTATLTNVISARAALGTTALRAVREDW
jgi:putative ABC transport system permease protein